MPILPPGAEMRSAKILVSLTPAEKAAAQNVARSLGLQVAQWVRLVVLRELARVDVPEEAEVRVGGLRPPRGSRVYFYTPEEPPEFDLDYGRTRRGPVVAEPSPAPSPGRRPKR